MSSLSAQSRDAVDAANAARSRAFTRACRSKNAAKVERMLKSGSIHIQQDHIDIVKEDPALCGLLVRSAAEMNGISVSRPWCPNLVSMPSFLVDYILESQRSFVLRRSGRFTSLAVAFEHGPLKITTHAGARCDLTEDITFKLLSCLEGSELCAWPALSRAFAFRLCDTAEFAKLHYRNTFAICYTARP